MFSQAEIFAHLIMSKFKGSSSEWYGKADETILRLYDLHGETTVLLQSDCSNIEEEFDKKVVVLKDIDDQLNYLLKNLEENGIIIFEAQCEQNL